jgi:hypothetical protein
MEAVSAAPVAGGEDISREMLTDDGAGRTTTAGAGCDWTTTWCPARTGWPASTGQTDSKKADNSAVPVTKDTLRRDMI